MDYYFSDVRSVFRNFALELYDTHSGHSRGFLVMSVSKKDERMVLKLLDHSLMDPSNRDILIAVVFRFANQYKVDLVELPEHLNRELEELPFSRWILHVKKRIYQFHPSKQDSPLGLHWKDIRLDYCDGDMSFS
jgi:hypothetical protein